MKVRLVDLRTHKDIEIPEIEKEVAGFRTEAETNPGKLTTKMRSLKEEMEETLDLEHGEIKVVLLSGGFNVVDSKRCSVQLSFLPGVMEKIERGRKNEAQTLDSGEQ